MLKAKKSRKKLNRVEEKPLIGDVLKQLRIDRKLSQIELARISGLTGAAICNYEQGIRIPKLFSFNVICKALEADMVVLLNTCSLVTKKL